MNIVESDIAPGSPQVVDMRRPEDVPLVVQSTQGRYDHVHALFGAAVVTMVVVVVGLVAGIGQVATPVVVVAEQVVEQPKVPELPTVPNPYANISVDARAFAVYDVKANKLLASENATTPLPLASLTKIMTTLVASESADPGTRLVISDYAIDTEGDSGLLANETWTLGKLIGFTMMTSSNDGADAIAAAVGGLFETTPSTAPAYERVLRFVDKMNARAQQLELSVTKYRNPTGLDEPGGYEGGVGSAEDMAKLIAYAWEHEPDALNDTTMLSHTYISEDGFLHEGYNTNEHVYSTPGMLGSKTGYTDMAGGNLAIIYNSGLDHPIAVVVLGSTVEGRFSDVQLLVDATYEYIASGWYEYDMAGSTPAGV